MTDAKSKIASTCFYYLTYRCGASLTSCIICNEFIHKDVAYHINKIMPEIDNGYDIADIFNDMKRKGYCR